jgi:predicted RNA-binding Zn ribbon-like protein
MVQKSLHSKYSNFRFDAGSLALNFVATVRHRGSQPRDLLTTPEALTAWFRLAGCKGSDESVSFQDHHDALLLREAIYRTLRALVLNETPTDADIDHINMMAACSIAVPQVDAASSHVQWKSEHPARTGLAGIARDAVMVIGGEERHRLKVCNSGTCQMLFIDHSPANRRRWCAMSICGNREKIKIYRRKIRSTEAG